MRRFLVHLLLGIALLFFACTRTAPHEEAVERAKKWLAALGDKGFVCQVKTSDSRRGFVGFKSYNRGVRQTQDQPDKLFIYDDGRRYLSIGFDVEVGPDASLEALRKHFRHIALDRLPPPDLVIPGWEVLPLTPVSSFKKGVEIVSFQEGGIRLQVQTTCFALYGRRPDVKVPADAPLPEGAYFQIRQSFPLNLEIDLPLFAGPKP
jgi:hypothetical protein